MFHGRIFERKGFGGQALKQLLRWSEECPEYRGVIDVTPKWGMTVDVRWVGYDGEYTDLLKYSYDSFDYNDARVTKLMVEQRLADIDWNRTSVEFNTPEKRVERGALYSEELMRWQCNYFNLPIV